MKSENEIGGALCLHRTENRTGESMPGKISNTAGAISVNKNPANIVSMVDKPLSKISRVPACAEGGPPVVSYRCGEKLPHTPPVE